tara:strand:+ start:2104 stop:2607 length:504 start_codon:yes stop_codon:yes gene_type:complete
MCPVCGAEIRVTIFPRLYHEVVLEVTPAVAGEKDSTCSFYPELKADKVCDECGCLMSSQAGVQWGDVDLCLPCLYRLREENQAAAYLAKASLHDNRALALVTWLAPFSLFTAPIALFLLIRHRRTIKTFAPRTSVRWWVAMGLSILWLVLWTVGIVIWLSLILEDFT